MTVVVDHGSLGGGIDAGLQRRPAAGSRRRRSSPAPGFSLTYVQRQPGFVCRINGQPASDPCVNTPPTNAYWGLWWSDGKSGSWSYSSLGAGSLTVPDGGYVAFAWQTGSQNAPSVAPTPHASTRRPPDADRDADVRWRRRGGGHGEAAVARTQRPVRQADGQAVLQAAGHLDSHADARAPSGSLAPATVSPDETNDSASPTATPTLAPSDDALPTASDSTSAAAAPSDPASTTSGETPDASSDDTAGALPAWAVPLVLLALAAGGGATYLLRRRHRTSP